MNNEDLYLEQLLVGPMDNFIYLIGSKSTREVAIIDPAWDIDALLNHIQEKELKLASVLVTHYHPDHIGGGMGGHSIEGIAELLEKDPVKIFVHKLEAEGVKKVTGVSDIDLNIVESGDHLTIGENDIEFSWATENAKYSGSIIHRWLYIFSLEKRIIPIAEIKHYESINNKLIKGYFIDEEQIPDVIKRIDSTLSNVIQDKKNLSLIHI